MYHINKLNQIQNKHIIISLTNEYILHNDKNLKCVLIIKIHWEKKTLFY